MNEQIGPGTTGKRPLGSSHRALIMGEKVAPLSPEPASPESRPSRAVVESQRTSEATATSQHRFAVKGTEYKLKAKEKSSGYCPSVRRGT